VSSSGEWRETKNREASQHRLSIRGLSFRAAEESLGRLSRSGPELLNRGSWQIREEALRQNRQLERSSWQTDKDALEKIQSCRRESLGRLNRSGPELLKIGSWQI